MVKQWKLGFWNSQTPRYQFFGDYTPIFPGDPIQLNFWLTSPQALMNPNLQCWWFLYPCLPSEDTNLSGKNEWNSNVWWLQNHTHNTYCINTLQSGSSAPKTLLKHVQTYWNTQAEHNVLGPAEDSACANLVLDAKVALFDLSDDCQWSDWYAKTLYETSRLLVSSVF